MTAIRQVSSKPLIDLLKCSSRNRSTQLDAIMAELDPQFQLDTEKETVLFEASRPPNMITIGLKCTCRLQAHAYAFGIALAALGTPGYSEMTLEKQKQLYDSADPLLNWAVSRDLREWTGQRFSLEEIFNRKGLELPNGILGTLNKMQCTLGEGLFRTAVAFILLHEVAHLKFQHKGYNECDKYESIEQEKAADWFAADWLINSPGSSPVHRLNCLYGVAVALLWETLYNVFFGRRESNTHPEGYDRLFQTLDRAIDQTDEKEGILVWELVSRMLFTHMETSGCKIETAPPDNSPHGWANYLIDMISKMPPC